MIIATMIIQAHTFRVYKESLIDYIKAGIAQFFLKENTEIIRAISLNTLTSAPCYMITLTRSLIENKG